MRKGKNKWFLRWVNPAGEIYRGVAKARRAAFEDGRRRQKKLPRPVLSIGNLTVGGTGKTPLVLYLCKKLSGWCHVAILTRGYGRKNDRAYMQLPSARLLDEKASRLFGDEAVLMARHVTNTSVHVGAKRFACGLKALERNPIDLFVLDDGFQHLELYRDLDIVVVDGQEDPRVLQAVPAGPLRESPEALRRADIVIINHCDPDGGNVIDSEWLRSLAPKAPIILARYQVVDFHDCKTGTLLQKEEMEDLPLFSFCGIGNPDSFMDSLEESELNVVGHRFFHDHHNYRVKELHAMNAEAVAAGAKAMITTEKDSVRIQTGKFGGLPLFYVEIQLVIIEGEEALWEKIGEVIRVG